MNDDCERCEGNGILAVITKGFLGDMVPVVCSCQTGKNAKAANPNWLTEEDV